VPRACASAGAVRWPLERNSRHLTARIAINARARKEILEEQEVENPREESRKKAAGQRKEVDRKREAGLRKEVDQRKEADLRKANHLIGGLTAVHTSTYFVYSLRHKYVC
jgi:hypothetical protein